MPIRKFRTSNPQTASSLVWMGSSRVEVELDQLGIALAKSSRGHEPSSSIRLDRISHVLEQRPDPGKESLDIPDPIVTDALSSPVITKLRQQFLDDKNKESEWSTRYGPDHQAARNLRAEMAALQRAIWDEISRIAESYKSELQIAKSQEASIDRRMTEVFQNSANTRQSQVRLRELETAANTYRGIYETFLSRFTQSVQQQSFPSTEARVVTLASPPSVPSSPKISLTLALGALCGLGLGVMSAFARERMNRQIHTRAQLEKLLGTSCLAVVPALVAKKAPPGKTQDGAAVFRQLNAVAPTFLQPPRHCDILKSRSICAPPPGQKQWASSPRFPAKEKRLFPRALRPLLPRAAPELCW